MLYLFPYHQPVPNSAIFRKNLEILRLGLKFHIPRRSVVPNDFWQHAAVYVESFTFSANAHVLLQRVYAERCISYSKSVRLSVRRTLALSQNDSS